MRRHPFASLAAVGFLVISGAGTAAASTPAQSVGQAAGNDQTATSNASTTQYQPSNSNIDVRIFSPGANGPVTQANQAGSAAVAGNANVTGQSAAQSGGGSQSAGQAAGSTQDADATATTEQVAPKNENISVRIGSDGANGPVTQSNQAGSVAAAGNLNATEQTAGQQQGGGDCKCAGGGSQGAGQVAHNDQSAKADAKTEQVKPSNSNISVRIHSPGDDGAVNQANVADSIAAAGNLNGTGQTATQQAGGAGGEQGVGQVAGSRQDADAKARTEQIKPTNENANVRIGSPGANGDVTQINAAGSGAIAANGNLTGQTADQAQGDGCGCHGGTGVQAVGQEAWNDQEADADAETKQIGASNANTPVRIGSPGADGNVTQANLAGSLAVAGNANITPQTATQQAGGGGGTTVQAIGQFAWNKQKADADAETKQIKPSNANTPVAIGGGGHQCKCGGHGSAAPAPSGGDVTQVNGAGSAAGAGNLNLTWQDAAQSSGDACGCKHGGTVVQAVGQEAGSKQSAYADATTKQIHPSNTNAGAGGAGGSVTQANLAGSLGLAGNANGTVQTATQSAGAGDRCGCKHGGPVVQAIGQLAWNKQKADADATTVQVKPSNVNAPVAIGGDHGKARAPERKGYGLDSTPAPSPGGGSVTQANLAWSNALSLNLNGLWQEATQEQ